VSAHRIGSRLTLLDGGGVAVVTLVEEVERSTQYPSCSRQGKKDGLERDHDELKMLMLMLCVCCKMYERWGIAMSMSIMSATYIPPRRAPGRPMSISIEPEHNSKYL
jgi:hypothetical protein